MTNKNIDKEAEEKILAEFAEKNKGRDRWDEQPPMLSAEDWLRVQKIMADLAVKYENKNKAKFDTWLDFNDEAMYRLDKMDIRGHVEPVVFATSTSDLKRGEIPASHFAWDEEGDLVLHPEFTSPMVAYRFVVSDWVSKDLKKSKAERVVEERESRRASGGSYHIKSFKDIKK